LGDVTSGLKTKKRQWWNGYGTFSTRQGGKSVESCTEKFSSILIKEALKMTGGNRSQAARLLGL